MDELDVCVVGAGVVGLAVGKALAESGREVIVLESESHFGEGVSSRNSEVIHAGISSPKDSLKALMCVEGKHRLYEYCASHHVGHQRCGKRIVATSVEEEGVLEGIKQKADDNGVPDLEYWGPQQLQQAEPELNATMALFSPSTGIVSSHELMAAYLGDIEAAGGGYVSHTRVVGVDVEPGGFVVRTESGGEAYTFRCRLLVNSAGLGAQTVAESMSGLDPETIPPLFLCKGNYFSMSGGNPFRHLVYPVPHPSGAGLGIHATIDLGGQVKFGPDVEYIDEPDYDVNVGRLEDYYEAVRRYFPGLPDGALAPAYTGIRPKLHGPDDAVRDYCIQGPGDHGVDGLVNLYGIESPGLTSSLAIGERVRSLLL